MARKRRDQGFGAGDRARTGRKRPARRPQERRGAAPAAVAQGGKPPKRADSPKTDAPGCPRNDDHGRGRPTGRPKPGTGKRDSGTGSRIPDPRSRPLDATALTIDQAATLAGTLPDQVRADLAAGAPANGDGTIHLAHYAAWLCGQIGRRP